MPNVEIDEVELLRLRKQDTTVGTLMKHPAARKKILQAYRDVDPNVPIPELDAANAAAEPVSAVEKKLDTFIEESRKEKAEREKSDKLNALTNQIEIGKAQLRKAGWTDEGIKGVEKIMEDKGILDVEVAATYFEKLHPPAAPATPSGTGAWNFMDQPTDGPDDLKKLIESKGESNATLDKLTRDALNEVRGQRR